jgi:Telomeric repeat-binding factor 2.
MLVLVAAPVSFFLVLGALAAHEAERIGGSLLGSPTGSAPAVEPRTRSTGDTFKVGYLTYTVHRSMWRSHILDIAGQPTIPNAQYLAVELTVRNDDAQARNIPPIRLVDSAGRRHDSTFLLLHDEISPLESLNPTVSKRGAVIFDVPGGRSYQLLVSGGYWSPEEARVTLSPRSN